MLTKNQAIAKLNALGKAGSPFSFYCDFLGETWCIEESNNPQSTFQLKIETATSAQSQTSSLKLQEVSFKKLPVPFDDFKTAFEEVVHQIRIGNSFLTNLTFQTPIVTNLSLHEIFEHSTAKYRLHVDDSMVVFSPETFIKINQGYIYSYPMKGTIDATVPNAEQEILDDAKEKAEHVTIVDLIRNDLSQVAEDVEVTKFRYIDELVTNDKKLLQVSSEVRGKLGINWKTQLGVILSKLLPAGSISGAPKPETIKIIQKAEQYNRGFYTGICGHFDGESLDTGVMIRFIRKENEQLFYCSGGGITSFSQAKKEYQEMVDKVYLAI